MKLLFVILLVPTLSGCSYLDTFMVQLEAERDAEVKVRHAALCQSPAGSALKRFREDAERTAFITLCDRDI